MQPMREGTCPRPVFRVDGEANRPELKSEDRVMTVPPMRRRRETGDEAGLHLAHHALERDGWDVVALVDDDVPVGGDEVVDLALPHQALDHGDVEVAVGLAAAAADLADLLRFDAQEHRQASDPLLEQLGSMNEDQRVPRAACDEICRDDRLPGARRRHEDSRVMGDQRVDGSALGLGQLAPEGDIERPPLLALVPKLEIAPNLLEQFPDVLHAPAREGDDAAADPRRS